MSALEQCYFDETSTARPVLRVVSEPRVMREGPALALRRARRARLRQRRRAGLALSVLVVAAIVIAWPGLAMGGSTAAGLSTDLADSSSLAAGMVYVVQPGDSVASIARLINPVEPTLARRDLVRELRSDVVVPGEHVLIP